MVITLTGSNAYTLKSELKRMLDAFIAKNTDFGLERYDAEQLEPDQLVETVQSLPFLAARRMVVVVEPSKNKPLSQDIEKVLDAQADTTDLLLIEPKPDKRTAYYKTLQKRTELKNFGDLDGRGAASWLAAEAKARGGRLSMADAQFLVNRAGTDQLMLSNELDKLLAYNPEITRVSISMLTEPSPQSTIFDLIDAALKGDKSRALELYAEQRLKKVEPQQVIALLTWQLRVLALIKASATRTPAEIAKQAGLNPFVVQKSATTARNLSNTQIKRYISELAVLDEQMKQLQIDPDEALKNYILSL